MNKKPVRATAELRRCHSCEVWKPHSHFAKSKINAFGSASECKPCAVSRNAGYVARNREAVKGARAAYYERNAEQLRATARPRAARWAKDNKDRHNANNAAWGRANRDKVNAKTARYARRYPHLSVARQGLRRAAKRAATPAWVNPFFIEEIYDLARLRTKYLGVKHHVDHIVPLQSKLVCGLHVENNLRVIPAFDNMSKKNRHWPDMP